MVEDPSAEMPGPKITDIATLTEFLDGVARGEDGYSAERKALMDKVFKYQDGNNCKRLMDFIENYPPQSGQ